MKATSRALQRAELLVGAMGERTTEYRVSSMWDK